MEKHIEVKICVCTLCSVMGGSDLQLLEEHLTPEQLKHVRIAGSINLENCHSHDGQQEQPPYASVDNICIPRATIHGIIEAIEARIKETKEN